MTAKATGNLDCLGYCRLGRGSGSDTICERLVQKSHLSEAISLTVTRRFFACSSGVPRSGS